MGFPANNEEEIRIYKRPISKGNKKIVEEEASVVENKNKIVIPKDQIRSVKESGRRTKEMVYRYARSNVWDWFVTLTFNPKKVDSFNFDETTNKMSQWLNNIRKRKCPEMIYIGVPELHESGRYHFHFLMSNISGLEFIDSTKRDKQGRIIYNIGDYKLGWTTATEVSCSKKASAYLTKYITDGLVWCVSGKKRYWSSKNILKPEEYEYMMNSYQLEDLRTVVKEKTFSSKVIDVNVGSFSNTIEYLQIKEDS